MTATTATLMQETTPTGVTVYTKPSCVQCNATYRALDAKGIDYDITPIYEEMKADHRIGALAVGETDVTMTNEQGGIQPLEFTITVTEK